MKTKAFTFVLLFGILITNCSVENDEGLSDENLSEISIHGTWNLKSIADVSAPGNQNNFEDGEKMNFEKEINIGEFCNLHYVNEFHQHIDFTFFAKAFSNVLKPAKGETKALYWFTREEIISQTKIKTSTKKYALYALDNVK